MEPFKQRYDVICGSVDVTCGVLDESGFTCLEGHDDVMISSDVPDTTAVIKVNCDVNANEITSAGDVTSNADAHEICDANGNNDTKELIPYPLDTTFPQNPSKNKTNVWVSIFFGVDTLDHSTLVSLLRRLLHQEPSCTHKEPDCMIQEPGFTHQEPRYTFSGLLKELKEFIAKYESSNTRFFIRALLEVCRRGGVLSGPGGQDDGPWEGVCRDKGCAQDVAMENTDESLESQCVRELITLLCDETGNFSDIFGSAYSHQGAVVRWNPQGPDQGPPSLEELCYYLHHAAPCWFPIHSLTSSALDRIQNGGCGGSDLKVRVQQRQMRFIDYPLNFGESPLMCASRHRKPDVILTLLRHGALIQSEWMCYRNALEVLLLAPSVIYLDPEELQCVELGTRYFLRACVKIDLRHVLYLTREGYVPLHPRWQQLIPEDRVTEPTSLRQQCRVKVRATLNRKCVLPGGIYRLPLPTLLKQYLDLFLD